MKYGDVYLNCPLSGDTFWYDWCSLDTFRDKYLPPSVDMGRFFFVVSS